MKCDTCSEMAETAYTLTTYVEGDAHEWVDLHFCSTDCLRAWV